jgi:phosphoglycolate phosphatase
MKRCFKLVVFDWDGTLMDSTGVIVTSLQAACQDLGLPIPSNECASHIIGLGLGDALAYVLPASDVAVYPQVAERYGYHYRLHDPQTMLFPGAEETLRELHERGVLLGLATGKSRRGLNRVLERTGLGPLFHATRCGDESLSKPSAAMLNDLMAMLNVDPDSTLLVGDTTHDLQMAVNAGVHSVAVAYGAHPRSSLLPLMPLACLDSPEELRAWLRSNV